jgi:hypothetical protein
MYSIVPSIPEDFIISLVRGDRIFPVIKVKFFWLVFLAKYRTEYIRSYGTVPYLPLTESTFSRRLRGFGKQKRNFWTKRTLLLWIAWKPPVFNLQVRESYRCRSYWTWYVSIGCNFPIFKFFLRIQGQFCCPGSGSGSTDPVGSEYYLPAWKYVVCR